MRAFILAAALCCAAPLARAQSAPPAPPAQTSVAPDVAALRQQLEQMRAELAQTRPAPTVIQGPPVRPVMIADRTLADQIAEHLTTLSSLIIAALIALITRKIASITTATKASAVSQQQRAEAAMNDDIVGAAQRLAPMLVKMARAAGKQLDDLCPGDEVVVTVGGILADMKPKFAAELRASRDVLGMMVVREAQKLPAILPPALPAPPEQPVQPQVSNAISEFMRTVGKFGQLGAQPPASTPPVNAPAAPRSPIV